MVRFCQASTYPFIHQGSGAVIYDLCIDCWIHDILKVWGEAHAPEVEAEKTTGRKVVEETSQARIAARRP